MKKLIIVLLIAIAVTGCAKEVIIPEEQAIRECVPDACCHATGCMLKQAGPECSGIMCSMECRDGTMDCGKGTCYFNQETLECDVNWQTEVPA